MFLIKFDPYRFKCIRIFAQRQAVSCKFLCLLCFSGLLLFSSFGSGFFGFLSCVASVCVSVVSGVSSAKTLTGVASIDAHITTDSMTDVIFKCFIDTSIYSE